MISHKKLPHFLLMLILTLPLVLYVIRPYVISHQFHHWMIVVVNSYPNFLEAVCGFLLLVIIAFQLKKKWSNLFGMMSDNKLYLIITIITSCYVFTRELKLHHLGGSNVFDVNDIIASILGLVIINILFKLFVSQPVLV